MTTTTHEATCSCGHALGHSVEEAAELHSLHCGACGELWSQTKGPCAGCGAQASEVFGIPLCGRCHGGIIAASGRELAEEVERIQHENAVERGRRKAAIDGPRWWTDSVHDPEQRAWQAWYATQSGGFDRREAFAAGYRAGLEARPHPLPNFLGLQADTGAAVRNARMALALGDESEPVLVELAVSAFGLGFQHGTLAPACGCQKCERCGEWRPGSWCSVCEDTV